MSKKTKKLRLTQPLKIHGGKSDLAARIVAMMPRHLHYVEPYFGGGSVLLARDPDDERLWIGDTGSTRGVSEVVGDLDRRLTNFWTVLQHKRLFDEMHRRLHCTPLARLEWQAARAFLDENPIAENVSVNHALAFFVFCRQSLSGRMKGFTGITRNRVRRRMNGNVSEYLGAIEGMPEVHERLQRVLIECLPALDLIRREDTPQTFFYCDPPYVHSARVSTAEYQFEMSDYAHARLLVALSRIKGKFMLSGYDNPLYDAARVRYGWNRREFEMPNNAAGGKTKRRMVECIWYNYDDSEMPIQCALRKQ